MSSKDNTNIDQQYNEQFSKPIMRLGPLTIALAGLLSLMPAIYLAVRYGALPSIGNILSAWLAVASTFGAFYIIEPISYFAVLGVAGTYMSFLSGNIGNMRLPAAAIAQETLGADGSTKKGELVGTLGIAGSIVTNIVALTIIGIAGQYILAILPPVVQGSLIFILPALFGAMIVFFAVKSFRSVFIAIPIAFIMLVLLRTLGITAPWLVILMCVFGTVLINYLLYKKTGKI